MVDYWGDLMNYEGYQASKKTVSPNTGEQIQEDIISWFESELPAKRIFVSEQDGTHVYEVLREDMVDELCQIVVDNFNKKSCN